MGRLTEIANRHTVDKGTEHYEKHGYTEIYDGYIPENGQFTLIEIGVWHGDSIRMWQEYNPELRIHGIDVNPEVFNFVHSSATTTIHIGDQSDRQFMENVITASGSPDFIIDDGSHHHVHIVESFKILWDYLKPGGYYFIEDLHAPHAMKDQTIRDILKWLADNNRTYKTMHSVLNDKLIIIHK